MAIEGLVIAGVGVAFVRSPRYLAEKIADAVDARMVEVRDERRFWRSVIRTWELRQSELPGLQERVATKYCKNLDVWKVLPALKREYRLIMAYSGPHSILESWRNSYPIDRVFDQIVEATPAGLNARDPEFYRLVTDSAGGAPEDYVAVDSTAQGVAAAEQAGLVTYRYGTSWGLRKWLVECVAA